MKYTFNIWFAILIIYCSSANALPFEKIDCLKPKYLHNDIVLEDLHYTIVSKEYGKEEKGEEIRVVPTVALKWKDRWIVGSDRGEFGGELVDIGPNGKKVKILSDNIKGIYNLDVGIVVLAGLSHLVSSSGRMYIVSENDSKLTFRILFELDSVPVSSWTTNSGELIVNTSYGSTVLSKNGELRRINCNGMKYSKQELYSPLYTYIK